MGKKEIVPGAREAQIFIVDDHPLVRAGFRALIGNEPDMQVCGEAQDFCEAMRLVIESRPDVVIVDLTLAEGSGLELIRHLHGRLPESRLLVCSMHDESLFAERALRAGARGYINKHEATDHVVDAIRQVLRGGVYLSEAMTQRLLHPGGGQRKGAMESLSDWELEVFGLIGQGIGTSRIAEQLHLSVKTVESHREKIKRKLNLRNAAELSRSATQWVLERN